MCQSVKVTLVLDVLSKRCLQHCTAVACEICCTWSLPSASISAIPCATAQRRAHTAVKKFTNRQKPRMQLERPFRCIGLAGFSKTAVASALRLCPFSMSAIRYYTLCCGVLQYSTRAEPQKQPCHLSDRCCCCKELTEAEMTVTTEVCEKQHDANRSRSLFIKAALMMRLSVACDDPTVPSALLAPKA